jgi:hypothetical protein
VLGAIVDLGNCLDLITRKYVPLIQTSYLMLKSQIEATGGKMPVNSDARGDKNSDKLVRKLDCAVINYRSPRKPTFRHPCFALALIHA